MDTKNEDEDTSDEEESEASAMEPPKPISSQATFVQLLLAIDKRLEEKSQVAHKHDQFMQENAQWGHSLMECFLQVNEEWQRTEQALADAHVSFLDKAFHDAHSLEFSCISSWETFQYTVYIPDYGN